MMRPLLGGVAERLNATVLKTVDGRPSVGSNPTPSARITTQALKMLGFFILCVFQYAIEHWQPSCLPVYIVLDTFLVSSRGLGSGWRRYVMVPPLFDNQATCYRPAPVFTSLAPIADENCFQSCRASSLLYRSWIAGWDKRRKYAANDSLFLSKGWAGWLLPVGTVGKKTSPRKKSPRKTSGKKRSCLWWSANHCWQRHRGNW